MGHNATPTTTAIYDDDDDDDNGSLIILIQLSLFLRVLVSQRVRQNKRQREKRDCRKNASRSMYVYDMIMQTNVNDVYGCCCFFLLLIQIER